jgi:hypothetical protein
LGGAADLGQRSLPGVRLWIRASVRGDRGDVCARSAYGAFDQVDVDNNGKPAQTDPDWAPGDAALSISDDGRFVLFGAPCTFLNGQASPHGLDCSRLFVRDRQLKKTFAIPYPADKGQFVYSGSDVASISADGRFVVFEGYDNGDADGGIAGTVNVYLFDVQARTLREVYETPGGAAGGGVGFVGLDGDGSEVVVQATECDQSPCNSFFSRLYVVNTVSGDRRVVLESHNNPAAGDIGFPQVYGQTLSRDGRWLAMNVRPNVNSLPQLNLLDLATGTVERPAGPDGQPIPSGFETWSSTTATSRCRPTTLPAPTQAPTSTTVPPTPCNCSSKTERTRS